MQKTDACQYLSKIDYPIYQSHVSKNTLRAQLPAFLSVYILNNCSEKTVP